MWLNQVAAEEDAIYGQGEWGFDGDKSLGQRGPGGSARNGTYDCSTQRLGAPGRRGLQALDRSCAASPSGLMAARPTPRRSPALAADVSPEGLAAVAQPVGELGSELSRPMCLCPRSLRCGQRNEALVQVVRDQLK